MNSGAMFNEKANLVTRLAFFYTRKIDISNLIVYNLIV
ncbi:hypothetical protein BSSX_1469 [Bacillus subtilis]|nr:hypothetical protein BSSX_1469 [Bacillus subtilis]